MIEALNWESPIEAFHQKDHELPNGSIKLVDYGFVPRFSVRGRHEDNNFVAEFSSLLGFQLPSDSHQVSKGNDRTVFWLQPSEWMVSTSSNDQEKLSNSLVNSKLFFSEVSDARIGMQISGPHAISLIKKSCSIDVRDRVFGPGSIAQTKFAEVRALIYRPSVESMYEIICERIWGEYLWTWLKDAATEYDSR